MMKHAGAGNSIADDKVNAGTTQLKANIDTMNPIMFHCPQSLQINKQTRHTHTHIHTHTCTDGSCCR